jgi:RarD protein
MGKILISKLFIYSKPMLAVVFWGVSFIATKYALNELTPRAIIFMRLILAIFFLASYALLTKKSFSIDKKSFVRIFILALIAVFHLWIQVTGLRYTTASNTGWIIGTAPIFIALLGFIFFKERFALMQTIGVGIALFGLLLLISRGSFNSIEFITNKGDFLILSSAFTWGVYSVINKKISVDFSPLMTILFLFIMMAVLISPFTIEASFINSAVKLSMLGWISILFLGIFCSGAAYVIWAQSLKNMPASKVGVFLYFEPFITVIAAWAMLNETITFLMILSGLIITLGVVLVNKN